MTQSSCQGFLEKKFKNLVTAPDYSYLPGKMVTEHAIETSGPPIYSKPRPLSSDKFNAAKQEFDHLLKLNIIHPSSSPWSSPLHMVRKTDGTSHAVIIGD